TSGNILVADAGNDRIQLFDSNGTFITKWGTSGAGDGQLDQPTGIATDSSGNVYVVDRYNNRIQVFAGQ
ncbi:MAG TPA: SBBP repeat-containing protein, partial [Nitrososphaeraceae archaeon]|nr:SBBP repeat-containing protein [Nitrososphaeraceae archaeon]